MRKFLAHWVLQFPEWSWILLGLALRLVLAWKVGGGFRQVDEGGFDAAAWTLARSGVLPAAAPLPSAFFALCFRVFGHSLLYPRLAQAFLSAATAWALGRMTSRLTGSLTAGRLALALSAIYPFFIYYSAMMLSETLYLAAVVCGLWWLCASLQGKGAGFWCPPAAGLALAAAALCRSEGAGVAAGIWAVSGVLCCLRRWSWRAWCMAVLFWMLPLLAWCARNQAVIGRFVLDNRGGIAMLEGTMFFDLNEIDTKFSVAAVEQCPFYKESLALPQAEQDRVFLRQSLLFMRAHPRQVLRQWARKSVNFWRFYPRSDKVFIEDARSHPGLGLGRRALIAISLLCEPALILGGFWGLWCLRRRWETLYPLGLFLLGTMAVHVLIVSQMRYRLPVMPILIFGAAWAAAAPMERRAA